MTFLLLNLLQPQGRISPVVIVGAVLVFIAGVLLLVYFYRRYKRIEKESEEEWDSSRRSLFVNVPPPEAKIAKADGSGTEQFDVPVTEGVPVQTRGTREFAGDIALPAFSPAATEPEPQHEAEFETPIQPPPQTAPPAEPRATEILASPPLAEAVSLPEHRPEASSFDEQVWTGQEIPEQLPFADEHEFVSQPTPELLSVARVDQTSHREPFEPPRIDRISHREAYESPTIEPLTPREAAATRELRSVETPRTDKHDSANTLDRKGWGTVRLGSASDSNPMPLGPSRPERETRELAGELAGAAPGLMPEPSIRASASPRIQRAGSILGLPAEPSHQPLILGEPVRRANDVGIGALTNYGKDVGPKGGRVGTIALLIVVVLFGGAVALYLFVPSVHSQVGAFVARVRGTEARAKQEALLKPRAQVIPSTRPEVNKNMVTARGAVDNISEEPLENLTVEVSLTPAGGATPETRTIPVTPNPLPPRERGAFEFEYDGKRDTGFAGYTITRLFSNGTEVRFRAPGQK